jgi:2-dehydro-3-deoxyphosphogluconate aldolase/(4S)-4-hydroxy-2-oxoglutarate aldolase
MDRADIVNRIWECGLVPAVRVKSEVEVLRVLEALLAGGIVVAEIAMSMDNPIRALTAAVTEFGDKMLLGAGTVLDSETARICILSGAQFLVSPSLNTLVIEMCNRYSVAALPGALTPTEIVAAWTAGADCVKVFPASAMGGTSYIRSLGAPLPQIKLMPMGGVSLETGGDYFAAGSYALGVGNDLTSAGDSLSIQNRARQYVAKVAESRLKR